MQFLIVVLLCISLMIGSIVLKSPPTNSGDARDIEFDPWIRKIPWSRKRKPTPILFPGKVHGQRSLAGCSPWGCKESDWTLISDVKHLSLSFLTICISSLQKWLFKPLTYFLIGLFVFVEFQAFFIWHGYKFLSYIQPAYTFFHFIFYLFILLIVSLVHRSLNF